MAPVSWLRPGRALVPICLLFSACSSTQDAASPPKTDEPAPQEVAQLSPVQHLIRASMVLRGVRPSLDDLRAVQADPSAVGRLVDEYVHDPRFGDTMRELHNEALKVRVAPGIFPAGFPARGDLAGMDTQKINLALTDAPLRLVQYVIENDRPYTEIVTADYTLANGIVAKVWGLPYDGNGEEWKVTRYTDGRPNAGVLSDSMLFTRHATTYSNSNRGRANAMSTALLCYDFLSREISADSTINLADPAEVANAVKKNAACASCHQSLDPLAAYFGSFHPIYVPSDTKAYPVPFYLQGLGKTFTSAEPGYFGQPGQGLAYLGTMIAQDPRFSLCAAKRFYAYFNNLGLGEVPLEVASALQSELVDKHYDARALAKAVVLTDGFKSSHAIVDDPAVDPNGIRKVRPAQLARMVEDLTGLRWTTELPIEIVPGGGKIGKVDLVTDALWGFEVLAGGVDAVNVTLPAHTMNASASLVLRALAAKAAPFVVENDFTAPDRASRKLLTLASASDVDEASVRAQLAQLHARLYGELVDKNDDAVSESWTLFRDALSAGGGDAKRAWTVVLFAMLQDIRVATY